MLDDLQQIGLQLSELVVAPGSDFVNQPIKEIEVRGNLSFLIVGVRRADRTTELNPPPSCVLCSGDTLIVPGHHTDLPELACRFQRKQPAMIYRGATVQ